MKIPVILIPLLLCACISAGAGTAAGTPEPILSTETQAPVNPRIECLYYDRDSFLKGIAGSQEYSSEGTVYAGMIPHHLLASDMIAGFFAMTAQTREAYDTVVLVSPSHFLENCGSSVVTSTADWNTPYGLLKTNAAITSELLNNSIIAAEDNPAAIEADHGAAGLIPFIKYYLPDADIAVCLLANDLSRRRLDELRDTLGDICDGGRVLLIASADCSHYLMPDEAAEYDRETSQAIESYDFEKLLRFSDSNIDSPQSVVTFLSSAQSMELTLARLDHSSSAEKLPHAITNSVFNEGITTYFVYAAYR